MKKVTLSENILDIEAGRRALRDLFADDDSENNRLARRKKAQVTAIQFCEEVVLSRKLKEIYHLLYRENYSIESVAEKLEMTRSNVYACRRNIQKKMKACLFLAKLLEQDFMSHKE